MSLDCRARRRFLVGLAGSVSFVTGCAGGPGDGASPSTTTEETTATATPTTSTTATTTSTTTTETAITSTTTSPPTATPTPAPPQTYAVGERFALADVTYRVVGVETSPTIGSGYGAEIAGNGVFVLVGVELRNDGDVRVRIRRDGFALAGEGRGRYRPDTAAMNVLSGDEMRRFEFVARPRPGQTVTGWLAFDVPFETGPWVLEVPVPGGDAEQAVGAFVTVLPAE
jgi:hypothetical protein